MIEPKGRISKARRNSRKAHWKLTAPSITACPRCHQMKLNHHVCKHCGYYDGRNVLHLEDKKKKQEA